MVEVTRRCNLQCGHCLRGNAQNRAIPPNYVHNFFKAIQGASIGTITFTGGEPALVPSIISSILSSAKRLNIDIENFYIATNGTINSKEFTMVCLEWYLYCSDNEISCVKVSNDEYHTQSMGYDYEIEFNDMYLSALKFVVYEEYKEGTPFLRQGRWKYTHNGRDNKEYPFEIEEDTLDGELYLNVFGQLINGCDWSYKEQPDHFICDASKITCVDDLIVAVKERNEYIVACNV